MFRCYVASRQIDEELRHEQRGDLFGALGVVRSVTAEGWLGGTYSLMEKDRGLILDLQTSNSRA